MASHDRDVLLVRRGNTALRLSHDIYPDICKYINNNNPEYLKLAFDPKLTTEEIYMILNPDSEEAYLKTHPFAVQIDDAITEEETRSSNAKKKYIAEMESKESTLSTALIVVTSLIFIPVLIFAIAMLVDEDWTSFVISMLVVGIFYLICVPKWLYYKRESAEQKHMPQNYVDQNKAMFVSLLGGKDIHTLLALPSHVMYNYNLRKDLVYYSVPKPFYAYQKKIMRIVEEYGLTGIVHMDTEPTISQILSSYPPPVQNQLSYPWVANMLADIQEEYDKLKIERVSKKAVKSAEVIQQIRKEKRILKTELSLVKNQLRVYESLFPWLEEFKELDISDAVKYAADTAYDEDYDVFLRKYLSPEEYSKLSLTEKNQLALDRYKARKKNDWEIGIEYKMNASEVILLLNRSEIGQQMNEVLSRIPEWGSENDSEILPVQILEYLWDGANDPVTREQVENLLFAVQQWRPQTQWRVLATTTDLEEDEELVEWDSTETDDLLIRCNLWTPPEGDPTAILWELFATMENNLECWMDVRMNSQ